MDQGSAIANHIPELDGPAPVPAIPTATPLVLDVEKLKFIETETTTGELIKTASTMEVKTAEQYTAADNFLRTVRQARKGVIARIAAYLDKNIKKAKELHQSLCDDRTAQQDEHEKPLAEIENKVIAMMRQYEADAKKERERLAAIAEEKRKEDARIAARKAADEREAQLKADAEKRLADTQRLAKEKLEKEVEAERLKAEGKTEEALAAAQAALQKDAQAAAVLAAPPPPAPAFIPPPPSVEPMAGYGMRSNCSSSGYVPKSKALGGRKDYIWTGTDKKALIEAAYKNPDAYAEFLDFNETTLNARAKSLKDKAGLNANGGKFPGVTFEEKQINSVRG